MCQGRAFRVFAGFVLLVFQFGACSGAGGLEWDAEPRLDLEKQRTVLIHKGDGVAFLDVTNGKVIPLINTSSSTPSRTPGMASFSPDGSEITFNLEGVGDADSLAVLNLRTGVRRLLLNMPYLDGPRWSPDGAGIAFAGRWKDSGDYSLYLYNLSDNKVRTLLEGELKGGEMLFSWSPDGKRIVVQSAANDLYVLDLTTGERARIDSGWFPTWSPDGRYVAYMADDADDPGYIVYDLETQEKERILRRRSAYRSLVWSPDSRYLIYSVGGRDEYYGDLFIFDRQTKKERLVLRLYESVYPTDWIRGSQPSVVPPK